VRPFTYRVTSSDGVVTGSGRIGAGVSIAQPSLASDGVRMGDNNRFTADGQLNGAQIATGIGLNANAQNGIASMMSGRGVGLGDNNTVTLSGRVNGAQIATAIGLGANAQNGVGSIMGGVR
jgi:hypothetical protein